MRVTSASASINSLVASAASRTLYDLARSEPGMTRIFGTAMADDKGPVMDDGFGDIIRTVACAVVRPSVPAIDPHPRRRNVHPYPLGGFRAHAVEPLRDRRNSV